MTDRVILAYSGGLDTTVAIEWMKQETGAEVVAVSIDVGQGGEDMESIRQRALDAGIAAATIRHPWNEDVCDTEDVTSAADWPELALKLQPRMSAQRTPA